MDSDRIIEILISAMPYPEQMINFDTSKPNYVYFTWRGNEFRVDGNLHVNELDGTMLCGSDLSMILQALLEKTEYELTH